MQSRLGTALATLILTTAASAQPTSFTYQGRLKNGAAVAAGLHDFHFRLFDAASGGNQVGATQCAENVLVTEGIFTATIDFGQVFTTPNQRFLEIEVRPDTGLDCSNATGFVLITPRQPITGAPIANHAKSAFSLDAANGSIANAVFVDNSGRVGIGTTAPTHSLTISNPAPALALRDTGSQQVGYVSYRDSANAETAWVGYGSEGDPDFSIVNARAGGDIVLNPFSGNVGVGTTAPAARLEVRGDIRLGAAGTLNALGGEENFRIIRGMVGAGGSRILGSGFTSTLDASSQVYTITFNTPFPSTPTVLLTPEQFLDTTDICAMIEHLSDTPASVRVVIFKRSNGDLVQRNFHIVVIGPR